MKKKVLSLCLCLVLLVGLLVPAHGADAADVIPQLHYGTYDTLSMIYNQGDCFSMQGMTLDSNYTYCAKVNTDTDASACIIRSSKTDGTKTVMINSATGGYYFSNLGHANALDMVHAAGYDQLFVTGGSTLVRLTMSGNKLTTAGTYTATLNGAAASMTAVQVMSASDQEIKVLVKTGRTLYTGTLDPSASSGNIALTRLCTLNLSSVRLKGETYDFSAYVQQGFDFHDNKLFLPLSSNVSTSTSIVLVYDLEGASGDIYNDPTLSFRVISETYAALFEIEDVAVCQETGRLYFNTNRRRSNSDTDHDACSYFLDYEYDPTMSTIAPADYRWETVNNELISTTSGGGTYNYPAQFHGSITNNVMTHGLYSLSRSVLLEHDAPWVVEWKSSGSFAGGAMLLASGKNSKVPNKPFLFRYKESNVITLGYYTGTQHNNYGIKLSDHGIDGTAEHVYRLTNKIASDGSNMVYLSVDGRELGAMNNYYIGSSAQGTTSNWVSGQDFAFSYIGSYNHPLTDCKLDYLQVWANGPAVDTPDVFEWTTVDSQLTAVSGSGRTQNTPILYNGSVSGSTYTNACFRLEQPVVLMHNRPWSFEWESEGSISGGTFLLSAAEGGMTKHAPFLFRYGDNGLLAIGAYDGTRHSNYGLYLSDYDIDSTLPHTYRLTNRINSDGSNMIYLYVDEVLVGPMNNCYSGLTSLNTTSDWLSGKDFVFDYLGNREYSMKGSYSSIRLWENGKTANTYKVEFRDYNGTLLSTRYYSYGQTVELPANPVRQSDAKYTYSFAGWSPAVTTVVAADAYYTATYTSTLNRYTVTFKNDDGTILWTGLVSYGEMPTAPENPTKAGSNGTTYTFTGWDQEITKVKGNAVYTAQYTAQTNTYTVLFLDDDGTVLSRQVLNHGETPVAPAAPTKSPTVSHTFSFVGWDAAIVPVNGDAVYTARYVSSLRKYTVTFRNTDGTVLSTQLIPYGYEATVPTAVPKRTPDGSYHYSFKGWSPTPGAITGETVYTAAYISSAHQYQTTTVAASCTASGRTTYTCSTCSYSYSKTIAATGHSYSSKVTAPTCTAQGYTTYTCTACGSSYKDSYTTSTGHSYSSKVTAPTCTAQGYTTYTCTLCGSSYKGNITAAKGHSYVNGRCSACGAVDPNYSPSSVVPTLTLKYPTVSFEDMIRMNVYYAAENIQDVVDMGLVTYTTKPAAANIATADKVLSGYTLNPGDGFYFSTTDGIAPKDLGDNIHFAIYAKLADGTYAYSKVASYSPKTYANSLLSTGSAEMKALVVAMLNYGAAAQNYFNYNTGSLMNASLTSAQKALVAAYNSNMITAVTQPSGTKVSNFVNDQTYTKRYPTISFEGAFCINYYFQPSLAVKGDVTMYVWSAEDYNSVSVLTKANATEVLKMTRTASGEYLGVVDGIAAKDLDKVVYVAFVYSDGTTEHCGGVVAYSIGAYCKSQAVTTGTMAELAKACAVYGYYAKQLFG